MNKDILYYLKFDGDYTAEGRHFLKGEEYPVLKTNKDDYVKLMAENGEFVFSNELISKVIKEWNLIVIPVQIQEEELPELPKDLKRKMIMNQMNFGSKEFRDAWNKNSAALEREKRNYNPKKK